MSSNAPSRQKDGRRFPMSTWQPRRVTWPWDRRVPPNDPRWPSWWVDVRQCIRGWRMYQCSVCGLGTARLGSPPFRCYHCGYNVQYALAGLRIRTKKLHRAPVPWSVPHPRPVPDPDAEVWTVPPWVQSTKDPFCDELPGERCW